MPCCDLTPTEVQRLAGHLRPEAPGLVTGTATASEARLDLFPDLRVA